MADFLLEIGTEEIPARMVDSARDELARRAKDLLSRERLAGTGEIESFSTPRRITVLARNVAAQQPDVQEQLTGPSVKVAFKDGAPTPAAEAFAKKAGLPVGSLARVTTPKGEYLAATVQKKGRAAGDILAESLPREIAAIYWAKSMYWRGKSAERFVRPVRWIVALLDEQVVPVEFGGITASHTSEGHRILSSGAVTIAQPNDYASKLADARVTVSAADRERTIRKALDAATRTVPGARWREDKPLIDTVVNLTEYPSVILGSFDPEFLSLPQEVLVTVMRDHQKYFAIEDAEGKLSPHFLAVLNTDTDPDGLIRHGNERVLRARFNDARFFWQQDQKRYLADRVTSLLNITFQTKVGNYFEKTHRVIKLVVKFGGSQYAETAAWLSKADLTTDMVKEFTDLQGVVGGLYAKSQGEPESVWTAIYDQYKPAGMEDRIPSTREGQLLSVVDRWDTLSGCFSIGLIPSGSRDPFALRRAAQGVVKILVEGKHRFLPPRSSPELWDFFLDRVRYYFRDVRGFAYDEVNAVLAGQWPDLVDVEARLFALRLVRQTENFEPLAAAFKRIRNILKQAGWTEGALDPARLETSEERDLHEASEKTLAYVAERRKSDDYIEALSRVAALRPVVDRFFDKVLVNAPNEQVRANRLALVGRLFAEVSAIADFSEIVTGNP